MTELFVYDKPENKYEGGFDIGPIDVCPACLSDILADERGLGARCENWQESPPTWSELWDAGCTIAIRPASCLGYDESLECFLGGLASPMPIPCATCDGRGRQPAREAHAERLRWVVAHHEFLWPLRVDGAPWWRSYLALYETYAWAATLLGRTDA